jgi:hypothetical protein
MSNGLRGTLRAAMVGALSLVLLPAAGRVAAQDPGWKNTAEISYVVAAGNASTATLGFGDKLTRGWENSQFELRISGIRAESAIVTRAVTAAGPPPVVGTTSRTTVTAENYGFSGRFNRKLSEYFFWYAGAGWKRNRFAGIRNQYSAAGGLGNTWFDTEETKFRTEYAATFTRQEDITGGPGGAVSFAGARISWNYQRRLTGNTRYGNDLLLDENLKDTQDFRADMLNSLQVAMSSRLALKVSLELLYDNLPSLVKASDPLSLLPVGEVALVSLKKLDTIFTVSLVVDF